jgi:hypothetical protein
MTYFNTVIILTISSRIRSYGKRFEVGQTGISFIYFFYKCRFTNVYFSISLRLGSHNETSSLEDTCHSTETL